MKIVWYNKEIFILNWGPINLIYKFIMGHWTEFHNGILVNEHLMEMYGSMDI